MDNKKEYFHPGRIKMSEDLSDEDKKYVDGMYGHQDFYQIPMLTDKIIVLTNRIKKLTFWTTIFSIALVVLTGILVYQNLK